MKAANEQRDTTQVTINQNLELSCGENFYKYKGNGLEAKFADTGTLALNIFDILRKNEFFKNYSSMYDSVRIDSCRVKIIGVNWITGNNNSSNDNKIQTYKTPRSYVVVTAWDRSGLSENDVIIDVKPEEVGDNHMYMYPYIYTNIGRKITTYSSALTKHLGPGSSYEIVRQCYPSSPIEKNQFNPSAKLALLLCLALDDKFENLFYLE